jgi:protein-S-isoprenylcysteine O-methyltransferase Ste14
MVAIVVPAWIIRSTGAPGFGDSSLAFRAGGAIMLGLGLFLWYRTVSLFVVIGKGTLAPWDPPRRFVVRGIYRHVRNPMITGVLLVLLGEATFLSSPSLFRWFLFFLALNLIYIPLIEEPELHNRFGPDYDEYRKNVPRWIPRMSPWDPEARPRLS